MALSAAHVPAAHPLVATSQPFTVRQVARALMRDFPGWLCWYGTATGAWWTLPPPNWRHRSLIEAATPEELANRIREICAPTRSVA